MPMEEEQESDQHQEGPPDPPDLVEESEDDFECQECNVPRILPDPGQPTQKQMDDHRVDHLPTVMVPGVRGWPSHW